MAFADGAATAHVAAHVGRCPRCTADAQRLDLAQRHLRHALHRFECPTPHTLGEYALELLTPEDRTAVAAHVAGCPRCTDELQTLRAFLRLEPAPTPATTLDRVRRVIAALVTPPRAVQAAGYAGLRGRGEPAAATYRAGDLTITVSAAPERRGRVTLSTLSGLVVRDDTGPIAAGGEITLTPPGDAPRTAVVDELGSFAFEGVGGGTYRLALRLPDQIVVVEDLRVGGNASEPAGG
jgi:hypothetical protein